ncbi:hypothetical protein LCGC14_3099730, partial [marine sediment metagenome]
MGLIPGIGGATLAQSRNLINGVSEQNNITPEESTEAIANATTQVDPKATPGKQQEQLTQALFEEIEVTKIVSRFPQKVTDQKSLEEVGNAIAAHLGIDIEATGIHWLYQKAQGGVGVGGGYTPHTKRIRISVGTKSKITLSHFLSGQRCKKCGIEKMSGENSPSYNHNLTDEDRIKGRKTPENDIWRKGVYIKND